MPRFSWCVSSVSYPHARTLQYDLPYGLDDSWGIVIGMKSLRSLDIYLEAYHQIWPKFYEYATYEIDRLRPLLEIRGLSTFRLQLGYIGLDSVIRYEPHAPAFRELLMEVVKTPRDS